MNYKYLYIVLLLLSLNSTATPQVTNNKTSQELMAEAKIFLVKGDFDSAIEVLNAILLMPKSNVSKRAQLLIGTAFDNLNNYARAKLEYQLYLNDYPEEENSSNVPQRIKELEIKLIQPIVETKNTLPRVVNSFSSSSSISTYFYSDAYTRAIANSFSNSTTMKKDEYTFNFKARLSDAYSLTDSSYNSKNKYKTSLLYASVDDTYRGYGISVGRQYSSHGMQSNYDGITVRYNISPDITTFYTIGTTNYVSYENNIVTNIAVENIIDSNSTLETHYNSSNTTIGTQYTYSSKDMVNTTILDINLSDRLVSTLMSQGFVDINDYRIYYLYDSRYQVSRYISKTTLLGISREIYKKYNIYFDIQNSSFTMDMNTVSYVLGNARFYINSDTYNFSILLSSNLSSITKNPSLTLLASRNIGKYRVESILYLGKLRSQASIRVNYPINNFISLESQYSIVKDKQLIYNTFFIGGRYSF